MAASSLPRTVGQLAAALRVPASRVRRIIDELVGVDCPRIGPYRVIAADLAERVRLELGRRGLLPRADPAERAGEEASRHAG